MTLLQYCIYLSRKHPNSKPFFSFLFIPMLDPNNPQNVDPQALKEIERDHFRQGFRTSSPSLIGIAAWGLVTGIAMIKSDLTLIQALGMSLLVFGGSAQLAALPLMVFGTPVWVIFITGLMVNLRFVIFSMLLVPHFKHFSIKSKLFWGYMTGDVSMIYFMARYPTPEPQAGKFAFLKGLFIPNWAAWQIGSIAGIFLGNQIPSNWGLEFAGVLAILCVLLPMLASVAIQIGVAVSGIVAVLTMDFPFKLGMLLAVLCGMASAMLFEGWRTKT